MLMMIIITITVDEVDIGRSARARKRIKPTPSLVHVHRWTREVTSSLWGEEMLLLLPKKEPPSLHFPEHEIRKAKPTRRTIIKPNSSSSSSSIQTRNRSKYSSSTLILNLIIKPLLMWLHIIFFLVASGGSFKIKKKFLLYPTPLTGVSAVDAELMDIISLFCA